MLKFLAILATGLMLAGCGDDFASFSAKENPVSPLKKTKNVGGSGPAGKSQN